MGDISEHFSRWEHACECGCGFDTVDAELNIVLEDLHGHFDISVHISGPNRCEKHNREVGGEDDSQHLLAKAADVWVADIDPDVVADYLEKKYPTKYGIGRYVGRTHVDVRAKKARWDKR